MSPERFLILHAATGGLSGGFFIFDSMQR
jgi:hypothetical protein